MSGSFGSAWKVWAAVHAIDSQEVLWRRLNPLTHGATERIEERRHCRQTVGRGCFGAVVKNAADLRGK